MENEQPKETSVIKCSFCEKVCTRYLAGRYPNGKDKKWVDEKGREFSGRTCPMCHSKRAANTNRRKRKSRITYWG
jgi:hypothetical protein